MLVGAAETVDVAPESGPAVTVTCAVCVMATPSAVAEIVFSSALLDDSVPVATPLTSVVADGCVSVFCVPLDASTTVAPLTGSPLVLRTVTVMVALPAPAVIGVGAAPMLESDGDIVTGAVRVTLAVWVMAVPLIVADTVCNSATDELRVPVATPLAFVGPAGWVRVLPEPLAARTTVAPLMGLPEPSLAVTVIVELPPPAEIDVGEAPRVDWEGDTSTDVTVTDAL